MIKSEDRLWVPPYTKVFSSCWGKKRPCPALWCSPSQLYAHLAYLPLSLSIPLPARRNANIHNALIIKGG